MDVTLFEPVSKLQKCARRMMIVKASQYDYQTNNRMDKYHLMTCKSRKDTVIIGDDWTRAYRGDCWAIPQQHEAEIVSLWPTFSDGTKKRWITKDELAEMVK